MTLEASLNVIERCTDAISIVASTQIWDSAQYDYSSDHAFQFSMSPFEASPSDCPVFYSCKMLSGPIELDLCSMPETE